MSLLRHYSPQRRPRNVVHERCANKPTKFMRELSVVVDLSTQYTNHCIRVTSIVNLKATAIEDLKICDVSGHKNVQSLNAYDRPTENDR